VGCELKVEIVEEIYIKTDKERWNNLDMENDHSQKEPNSSHKLGLQEEKRGNLDLK